MTRCRINAHALAQMRYLALRDAVGVFLGRR
jgi:hypothetical protein